ncbi:ABC transporter ATP-binding protein [Streptomyces griseoviridis]|uniref:ABC transporter n=1 Tax=Streptomyces griseoviridis TaxID=45398 RepID=A0A918GE50_STRGD|nr:ABC transporter ATP-binding protein [Streptomyces niveoruber]GGS31961.1 ABC transporter [Streptomyces niveoruber]
MLGPHRREPFPGDPVGIDPSRATVRLTQVTRTYGAGSSAATALDRVSTGIAAGAFTAVMGPSGSGKSTFLHCAAGLDRPTSGTVQLGGEDLGRLSEKQLIRFPRTRIGFVFQAFNVLPSLTVERNITLPLRLAGAAPDHASVHGVTASVGLTGLLGRRPSELSGGQQQRVAIARALITRPEVLFADEPAGALGPDTAEDVLGLLRQAVTDPHRTVVMVTHDPAAARRRPARSPGRRPSCRVPARR